MRLVTLDEMLPPICNHASGKPYPRDTGALSERIALAALECLLKAREIRSYKYVDLPGEDFSVTLLCECSMGIEVKTSDRGKYKHYERYGSHFSSVLVIDHFEKRLSWEATKHLLKSTAEKIRAFLDFPPIRHRCDEFRKDE